MGLNKSIPLDTQHERCHRVGGNAAVGGTTRKGGRPAVSEHTSVHTAEHEDEEDQELVPATGGSLAGRGHRPVRYRPSTGYLPWLLTMCDRELARHMTRLLAELDLTEAQYGVLQALVVAHYALDTGDADKAARAIRTAHDGARSLVEELLGPASTEPLPGDLRRRAPATE